MPHVVSSPSSPSSPSSHSSLPPPPDLGVDLEMEEVTTGEHRVKRGSAVVYGTDVGVEMERDDSVRTLNVKTRRRILTELVDTERSYV